MNFFDYIGAILSYIIIAMALFAGKYDNLTATELSAEISKVWKSPASCFTTGMALIHFLSQPMRGKLFRADCLFSCILSWHCLLQ